MPTYRVTGPDGQTYNVTPPEGTNPSQDEILARVQAQVGGAAAPPADTRSGLTRAYDAVAQPVTKAASWAANQLTEPLVAAERLRQGEPVGQIAKSYVTPGGLADAYRRNAQVPNPIAEAVVPQTPIEAAAQIGTGGAGYAAKGLPRGYRALSRVLGGAVGGEAANQAEQGTTGKGAAVGGLGAAVGEVLGSNRLNLAAPGGKRAANRVDAKAVGDVVAELSPELAGAKTATDLRQMAAGSGYAKLGEAKGSRNAAIQAQMGQKITVPSLSPAVHGYTLQEANDKLSEIGAKAFSRDVAERNFNGIDQRRLYGEVHRDMVKALRDIDPALAEAFKETQAAYRVGVGLIGGPGKPGPLTGSKLTQKFSDREYINMPYLQDYIADPAKQAKLVKRLGQEGFDKFAKVVQRGAPVGLRDELAPGKGTMLDAARMIFGEQKGGTGAILGGALRTFLPNWRSQYVGKAPDVGLSGPGQALADMLAQKAAAKMQEDTPSR